MRLFAALPLPVTVRDSLTRRMDELKSADWPVRWVRDEGLHLTLKFFGQVAPERLLEISQALEAAARGTPPLPLSLSTIGAFPAPQRARVIWIGVDATAALELLADRVERECQTVGFPIEGKPFRPHVTLGRVREGGRIPAAVFRPRGDPGLDAGFVVEQLVLYESRPGARGSSYSARSTIVFTGPSVP